MRGREGGKEGSMHMAIPDLVVAPLAVVVIGTGMEVLFASLALVSLN